jgi:hypothetical protein
MYQIIGTKALSGNLPKFEFKYFEIELLHVRAIHPVQEMYSCYALFQKIYV